MKTPGKKDMDVLIRLTNDSDDDAELRVGSSSSFLAASKGSDNPAIAVRLIILETSPVVSAIYIRWETLNETNYAVYHLWRSDSINGNFNKITDQLIYAKSASAHGEKYSYLDHDIEPGKNIVIK